ncbi:ribonuclease H-like domain-containing protein [Syncephalastrum racemosum]|uniref:3'-5' exonuclease n=1 Tax=Syncephalastrum racemosum TaxID=13706 RepID=A0A1X2HAU3_SYNRA|nr:ribonuclease H-like domain-containing protein [Syncephalastrum racemosum]
MIENVRVTETVTTTVSVNKDSGYSTKSAADSAADTATETATPKVKRTKSINSVNSLEETAPTKSAEPVKSTKPTKRTTKSTKEVPSGSVKIPWTLRKVLRHAQRDYEAAEAAAKERNEEYKGSPSDILKSEHIERLAALHLPKRYTIHYAKSKKEIDAHIETFLSSEERVFGLDVEWRPQFQKGEKEHRVSLIQICGRNTILLAHIPLNSKTLPPLLNVFLQRRDIYKTGVNIDGDGRKLFRDFNIRTNGLLDIIAVTKHLPPDTLAMTPRRSLRFLTAVLLEKNMAKPKRVQLSNWASPELSESQKRYAALDAYASFKVYETIHEKLEDHSILEGLVAHLEDRDMEAMAAKSAREKHKEKENKAMPTSTTVVIKPSTKEHETVQDLHKKIAPPVQSKSDTVHLSSKKPVEEAVSIERQ